MLSKGLDAYISPSKLWELGKTYEIDTGYALTTFILETGWGRMSDAWINGNNPAGIMCNYGYCKYSNQEEGFTAMFKLLKQYTDGAIDYIGTQKTVQEVRQTWSETDDTEKVVEIWNEIKLGG